MKISCYQYKNHLFAILQFEDPHIPLHFLHFQAVVTKYKIKRNKYCRYSEQCLCSSYHDEHCLIVTIEVFKSFLIKKEQSELSSTVLRFDLRVNISTRGQLKKADFRHSRCNIYSEFQIQAIVQKCSPIQEKKGSAMYNEVQ